MPQPSPARITPSSAKAQARPRGAPKGNKNALKHGRRSRHVIEAVRTIDQLRRVPQIASIPDTEFDKAFRWSRYEAAALAIAVHKKAELIRYYVSAVAALQDGDPVPPQPSVMLSSREEGLYRIYVEQQRMLHAFGGAAFGQEAAPTPALKDVAAIALAALEEWQLASNALDDLGRVAAGIIPRNLLPPLRRLAQGDAALPAPPATPLPQIAGSPAGGANTVGTSNSSPLSTPGSNNANNANNHQFENESETSL